MVNIGNMEVKLSHCGVEVDLRSKEEGGGLSESLCRGTPPLRRHDEVGLRSKVYGLMGVK